MSNVVSMIPYANMAPYHMLGPVPGCRFEPLVPSASVTALLRGEVVAAAVPVGALPTLEGKVSFLGEFGIAASEAVKSVLLFSKCPLRELVPPGEIHLTSQSATSIRLLHLILGYTNGFHRLPYVTDDRERADGVLLIGDDALRRARDESTLQVIDLATEWHRVHQKPFVFARWVIRNDAPGQVRDALETWLNRLRDHDDEFVLASAPAEAERIGISTKEMVVYLRGMKRILGKEELEGQAIFLEELTRHAARGLFQERPARMAGRRRRVDLDECVRLLAEAPLGEVMAAAHDARMSRHPGGRVTYVRDTNPNYTNICTARCTFCAFCKRPGEEDAYTLSPEGLAEKVKEARDKGATTVLLQGGHNPEVSLDIWLGYIRAIQETCPEVHLHPFSPPEVLYMAGREGVTTLDVLKTLRDAGIDTMPGGGAEILSNEIRREIAPKKYSANDWLRVMREAHGLGFRTTATMMFGHVETHRHVALHLLRLREVQDDTGGFSSFIPWSFKPGGSELTKKVPVAAHPARYLRILAVARLTLDNFDHIQSSWFSESERAGMLGLMAGADDFGGILVEENVLKKTGYERQTTEERVRALIREAGFAPAQRDSRYQILETQ